MVPNDFPRAIETSALPGSTEKFVARLIDGRYVVGMTPDEVELRYEGCIDLVEQLQKAALQFATQNPTWSSAQLCDRLRRGIEHERLRWKLSPAEARWILKELARREGWDLDSTAEANGSSAP
ncbi:hypothetical protein [Roseateles sp.]|uniref:hypothetical protein n=1 Tax=Roseateles sp. TaxID=1971397 RepID=UPI0039E78B3F